MKKFFLLILSLLISQTTYSNTILNKLFENKGLIAITGVISSITAIMTHKIFHDYYLTKLNNAKYFPNDKGKKKKRKANEGPKEFPYPARSKNLENLVTNNAEINSKIYATLSALGVAGICLLVSKIYNSKSV